MHSDMYLSVKHAFIEVPRTGDFASSILQHVINSHGNENHFALSVNSFFKSMFAITVFYCIAFSDVLHLAEAAFCPPKTAKKNKQPNV